MYSGGIAIVIAIVGTYLSASSITMTSWDQTSFRFSSRGAGCYLVTNEVLKNVPEIKEYKIGMLNLFLQHTSAGLSLNENCDPDVREDMETSLQRVVPEGNHYIHDAEGPDDMPGHVKSSLVGVSLDIPIRDGRLATGTWQGIYLCEFRRMKHSRSVVATIQGQKK
jgi:secondary thiamine-phosphate synthase enzyme